MNRTKGESHESAHKAVNKNSELFNPTHLNVAQPSMAGVFYIYQGPFSLKGSTRPAHAVSHSPSRHTTVFNYGRMKKFMENALQEFKSSSQWCPACGREHLEQDLHLVFDYWIEEIDVVTPTGQTKENRPQLWWYGTMICDRCFYVAPIRTTGQKVFAVEK